MHAVTFTKDTRLEVKAMVDLKTLHTLQEIATYGLSGLRITPALRDTIQELVCCLINPIRPLPEFGKPRAVCCWETSPTRKETSHDL